MYFARLVKGRHPNDCDATSSYTDRLKAATKAHPESENCSSAARPAISKDQLCQLVRPFPLLDDFALFAAYRWISLLCVKSEVISMRRKAPSEDASGMGRATTDRARESGDGRGIPTDRASPSQKHGIRGVPQPLMLLRWS